MTEAEVIARLTELGFSEKAVKAATARARQDRPAYVGDFCIAYDPRDGYQVVDEG